MFCSLLLVIFAAAVLTASEPGAAQGGKVDKSMSIPAAAHNDKIMALPDEVRQMQDWVMAAFKVNERAEPWINEEKSVLMFKDSNPPFSFIYGGKPSSGLLPNWKHSVKTEKNSASTTYTAVWDDPETGLKVTAITKSFGNYPAVDWVLYFENTGTKDTPIIENIQALDVMLRTQNNRLPSHIHTLWGDDCSARSFLPRDESLEPGRPFSIAPNGGRSSDSAFPFFNFRHCDRGIIWAIGWTGQWAASFNRFSDETQLCGGMEKTHLLLHPGERIRTPRILIMAWKGDRMAAHNRFRRLLLFEYAPKQNGKPVRLPVALQCFDRYNRLPDWGTEKGQLSAVEGAKKLGCDTLWLDAAWFDRGFPHGVGTWHPEPNRFPNGLKPISDACHKLGMEFLVWFEPERVGQGSEIAEKFPEYLIDNEEGGLFRLDDPKARKWITDLLLKDIKDFGVDIYRQDFNMFPLESWRSVDTPDRQGMTEIRFIEGLYEMWDTILAKHPGMLIDNCASGGRRIDLEMCMRSVPLWRSDTNCAPGRTDWHQSCASGLSLYVPLHAGAAWDPTRYEFRSASTAGVACQLDFLNPEFPLEQAKEAIEEAKECAKYWYGDFYPLTPCTTSPEHFMAFQLHRPDLDEGMVVAFRRAECVMPGVIAALGGIDSSKTYSVEYIDEQGNKTSRKLSGKELLNGIELRIPDKGSSLLVRYKAV